MEVDSRDVLVKAFPKLANEPYTETSPSTTDYNCIAWAAGDVTKWWEPDDAKEYYWPQSVKRSYELDSYRDAYLSLGYRICKTTELERGHLKVAIYVNQWGRPTHAARQLSSGRWTSKLGEYVDIEHERPESLVGKDYGKPVLYLKKSLGDSKGGFLYRILDFFGFKSLHCGRTM